MSGDPTLEAGTWCLTEIEDMIRTVFSNLTKFQDWTSSANPTEALDHVKIGEDDPPAAGREYTALELSNRLPLVIVEPDEDDVTVSFSKIASGTFGAGWGFNLRFLAPLDSTKSDAAAIRKVVNQIGPIMLDFAGGDLEVLDFGPIGQARITHYSDSKGAGEFVSWVWTIQNDAQLR